MDAQRVDPFTDSDSSTEEYFEGDCSRKLKQHYRDAGDPEGVFMSRMFYDPDCGCTTCERKWERQRRIIGRRESKGADARRLGIVRSQPGDTPSQPQPAPAEDERLPLPFYYEQRDAPPPEKPKSSSPTSPKPGKRYIVRSEMLKDVCMRLQTSKPAVDAYNDARAKVCDQAWGRYAWAENWDFKKVGLIWGNPAVKDMYDVIRKIRKDGAQMILFVPEWDERNVNDQTLWNMVKKHYFYGPEWPLYKKKRDVEDQAAASGWGTWALLVDGSQKESNYQAGKIQKVRRTDSSRRAYRRKMLKGAP